MQISTGADVGPAQPKERSWLQPLAWGEFRVILDWDGGAFLSCPSCGYEIGMQFEDNRLSDLVRLAGEHRCAAPPIG